MHSSATSEDEKILLNTGLRLFVAGGRAFQASSCDDIRLRRHDATDSTYWIFGWQQLPVLVYCANMDTSNPKTFLNLLAGANNNYETDYHSRKNYFSKIAMDPQVRLTLCFDYVLSNAP